MIFIEVKLFTDRVKETTSELWVKPKWDAYLTVLIPTDAVFAVFEMLTKKDDLLS